jgi:8-oxo-dGTP pyrophosphatase MutT (NUDIX family)
MSTTPAPARPSASVVVVRDGTTSLEILLLRRHDDIAFHGGAWVFPGGRVDAADGSDDLLEIAKRAAMREAHEEAGLHVSADAMLPFAHWTTPIEMPKRFATWFFAAVLTEHADVQVDGTEIVGHRWITPADALALQAAGELELPAPTFVTLTRFKAMASTAELMAELRATAPEHFVPRLVKIANGRCTLYSEDAGYESVNFDAPGARHRLVMQGNEWRYIREF